MNKKYIIKDTREFTSIINKRKRVGNEFFVIYINPKKEIQNRYGITVPKKLGTAVLRNKVKRQIKEIIRKEPKYFELQTDCIIIVKEKGKYLKFDKKQEELYKLLNKIN